MTDDKFYVNRVDLLRPVESSVIYQVSDVVYDAVRDYMTKYPHTGAAYFNSLSQNYIISTMKYEHILGISTISGLYNHNFSEVHAHFYDESTEGMTNKTMRTWADVYNDMKYTVAYHKDLKKDHEADFFFENVLIETAVEVYDNEL